MPPALNSLLPSPLGPLGPMTPTGDEEFSSQCGERTSHWSSSSEESSSDSASQRPGGGGSWGGVGGGKCLEGTEPTPQGESLVAYEPLWKVGNYLCPVCPANPLARWREPEAEQLLWVLHEDFSRASGPCLEAT